MLFLACVTWHLKPTLQTFDFSIWWWPVQETLVYVFTVCVKCLEIDLDGEIVFLWEYQAHFPADASN